MYVCVLPCRSELWLCLFPFHASISLISFLIHSRQGGQKTPIYLRYQLIYYRFIQKHNLNNYQIMNISDLDNTDYKKDIWFTNVPRVNHQTSTICTYHMYTSVRFGEWVAIFLQDFFGVLHLMLNGLFVLFLLFFQLFPSIFGFGT